MDSASIGVMVGGIAAIGFVVWYFFGPRRIASAAVNSSGAQEINVTVKGGYSPDVIVVRKGTPVRLNFYRDETDSCSEKVIFGDFGIARDLPPFKTTAIELTPEKEGEFTFTCGMNMLRGRLIVEAGDEPARGISVRSS
jgi:plastocyanin domain-containing protein